MEILRKEIREQLLKVLREFIDVYPTITDEDCWDGQSIFETALHQCGFFDLDEEECGTDVYEYLHFQLYKITHELKNEVT